MHLSFSMFFYNEFLKNPQDPEIHTFIAYSPTDSKKIVPCMCFPFALEEGRRPKNAFRITIVLNTWISINGVSFELKYVQWFFFLVWISNWEYKQEKNTSYLKDLILNLPSLTIIIKFRNKAGLEEKNTSRKKKCSR